MRRDPSTISPPPAEIRGAAVLEFGVFPEPMLPIGYPGPLPGNEPLSPAVAAAICKGPEHQGFYVHFCSADWRVVTSEYNETVGACKKTPIIEYGVELKWLERSGTISNDSTDKQE
jgi:hypothetical protein